MFNLDPSKLSIPLIHRCSIDSSASAVPELAKVFNAAGDDRRVGGHKPKFVVPAQGGFGEVGARNNDLTIIDEIHFGVQSAYALDLSARVQKEPKGFNIADAVVEASQIKSRDYFDATRFGF